jgi:hypothetical protein
MIIEGVRDTADCCTIISYSFTCAAPGHTLKFAGSQIGGEPAFYSRGDYYGEQESTAEAASSRQEVSSACSGCSEEEVIFFVSCGSPFLALTPLFSVTQIPPCFLKLASGQIDRELAFHSYSCKEGLRLSPFIEAARGHPYRPSFATPVITTMHTTFGGSLFGGVC